MKATFLAIILTVPCALAQSIPGVPEPGITVWGTVTHATTGAAIPITSASWTLTDSSESGQPPMVISSNPPAGGNLKPQVRILTNGGVTYYVMQVPFDTRSLASGTLVLGDPNSQADTSLRYRSFAMKTSAPPTYAMTPAINGTLANLKSVDGVNATGASYTTPGSQNPGLTFSERARVVRVDLTIAPPADPYDAWAAGFFPGHPTAQSGRTADADGDGQSNESEYVAGTNPTQTGSVLRVLTLSRAANGGSVTLNWASVAGRKYQIETSLTGQGGASPWTAIGAQFTATGPAASQAVSANPAEPLRLYRVRVVP